MTTALFKRAAMAATALTFTLATATASFAGDCSSTKNKSAMNQTEVMGATVYKTAGNYSSAKTYASQGTIIDAAVGTPDLSTLTAAVKAAGLVETLQGDGPFTVFAPTNAAFDALPDGTVATLLKPENNAMLTNILTSHVVAGNFSAADLVALVEANGFVALWVFILKTFKLYDWPPIWEVSFFVRSVWVYSGLSLVIRHSASRSRRVCDQPGIGKINFETLRL